MQEGRVEFRVLSQTRHRLRVRILGSRRERRHALESITSALRDRNDVEDFHVNPTTGSVTILYRSDAEQSDIAAMLAQAGVQAEERPNGSVALQPSPASDAAVSILSGITRLDALMSRALRRRLDLKSAVPLALLALGAWKVATQGIGWKQIPASTLIWYAYSTFKDLDVPAARHSQNGSCD